MNPTLRVVVLALALFCFLIAAFVDASANRLTRNRVDFLALGLAFLTLPWVWDAAVAS